MRFIDDINTLVKLYAEGGIEICTGEEKTGKSSSDNQQVFMIRTLIQPDADVVMYVSEEVGSRPDIWRQHYEKVRHNVDSTRRLRRNVKRIWVLSPVLFLSGYVGFGLEQVRWFILVSILSLIPLVLKPAVRYYLQRRIKKEAERICLRLDS